MATGGGSARPTAVGSAGISSSRPAISTNRGYRRSPRTSRRICCSCTPVEYRNPGQLPDGGVLVVGAGPSGQQIADELARSGRRVHLAVGRHQMLPRRYRGQDSYWWMDRLGMLSRTADTLSHPDEKYAPNAVLTGGVHDLDLHRLVLSGVRPHGRLTGIDGTVVTFADNLERTVGEAEGAAVRFRAAVDEYVRRRGSGRAARTLRPEICQPIRTVDAVRGPRP